MSRVFYTVIFAVVAVLFMASCEDSNETKREVIYYVVLDDEDEVSTGTGHTHTDEPEVQQTKYKQCPLCYGLCTCGGCAGTGMIYSCFYGDEVGPGRFTECNCCSGSGRCPMCEGTGVVEDFGW